MKRLLVFLPAIIILLSACQASNMPKQASAAQNLPVTNTSLETTPPLKLTNTPLASNTEAPGSAGEKITQAKDIEGIWNITTHPHYKQAYWLVQEDGTYKFSPNVDGGRPSESGKYWFQDGQLFITDDFCPKPGRYDAQKTGGPVIKLSMKLVEDQCAARVKILTGDSATWYGPLQ